MGQKQYHINFICIFEYWAWIWYLLALICGHVSINPNIFIQYFGIFQFLLLIHKRLLQNDSNNRVTYATIFFKNHFAIKNQF